jgi:hypothetical protein
MEALRVVKLAAGSGLILGAVILVAAPNASRPVQAGGWRYNED